MADNTLEKREKATLHDEPKRQLVVNRYTKVTEENIDLVTNKIFESDHPCIAALQVANNKNTLRKIIWNECVMYDVPLLFLMDGGFRMSTKSIKVNYHGAVAIQLWKQQAEDKKLPTAKRVEIRFIHKSVEALVAAQPFYYKCSLAMSALDNTALMNFWKSDPSYKEIIDNIDKYNIGAGKYFILIPKEQVYGIEHTKYTGNTLLFPSNQYEFIGAIGHLHFFEPDEPPFYFKYQLDPSTTALKQWDKPSAYAKNPLQFLNTKFWRHSMQSYYNNKITILPEDDNAVDRDDIIDGSYVEDRIEQITAKMEERKEKTKKAKNLPEDLIFDTTNICESCD